MKRFSCLTSLALLLWTCGQAAAESDAFGGWLSPVATGGDPKPTRAGDEKKRFIVTERAAAQVRELMKKLGAKYLRVHVSETNQMKLDLDVETDPKEDLHFESRAIPIVVDRKSSPWFPMGLQIDFINEKGRTGFKLILPEAQAESGDASKSLAEARRGFKTKLLRRDAGARPAPNPPADIFDVVRYDSPVGKLTAYLTPDPKDGKKRPAIIWITGGDCNSIDQGCWREGGFGGDQSASAYRKAGLVMMFPSLRGGNDNPGDKEGFFDEVADVRAAADFLARQPHVDPKRIYLGGHSTGGTLVLLTAECTDRFRAVFSFGPVKDVVHYQLQYNPFQLSDSRELRLRAPGLWLHAIRSPVFVFEGTDGNSNDLRAMASASKNSKVVFIEVMSADHFNLLGPINRLIAERIQRDTGLSCNLTFSAEEINKLFSK